jgi:hypothetical protein
MQPRYSGHDGVGAAGEGEVETSSGREFCGHATFTHKQLTAISLCVGLAGRPIIRPSRPSVGALAGIRGSEGLGIARWLPWRQGDGWCDSPTASERQDRHDLIKRTRGSRSVCAFSPPFLARVSYNMHSDRARKGGSPAANASTAHGRS